jgi:hypothetical protein
MVHQMKMKFRTILPHHRLEPQVLKSCQDITNFYKSKRLEAD